ncbi:substrate-binding domain-containing protein [Arthrobacter sp. ISL-69]|nr:substrate-binding domain-containing protein [Arthrobacter sp. ISL-69]
MASAVRTGIRVPEDLSVVGHDNSPLAARYMPSISSVAVDMERLGLYMAGVALHLAEGHPLPEPPSGAASLVRRESATRWRRPARAKLIDVSRKGSRGPAGRAGPSG